MASRACNRFNSWLRSSSVIGNTVLSCSTRCARSASLRMTPAGMVTKIVFSRFLAFSSMLRRRDDRSRHVRIVGERLQDRKFLQQKLSLLVVAARILQASGKIEEVLL